METAEQNSNLSCISAILSCFTLSALYVASLHVWNSPYDRGHSAIIKRRFFSVFIISFISPVFLYLNLNEKVFQKVTIWELLGLRWSGLIQAIVLPLLLTMVLFLGPLTIQCLNGLWGLYTDPMYWKSRMRTLIWWRNQIVAPLSEEWTFRASHFHHVIEKIKMRMKVEHILFISCLQFAYTTLFGAYAAFLFIKTGHFIAPFAVHSFCNHMGFPDLSEVVAYKDPLKRAILLLLFVVGVVAWCFLLTPLTRPTLFNNNLFWHKHLL